jgi:hypothetical protein
MKYEEINMDAVMIGAILSVAISIVIFVVLVIKGIALIKADPSQDK